MKLNPETYELLKTWKEDYKVDHKINEFIIVGDEDFELAKFFCKKYSTSEAKSWVARLDEPFPLHFSDPSSDCDNYTHRDWYKEHPLRLPDDLISACSFRRRHDYASGIRQEIEDAINTEFQVTFFDQFVREVYLIFSNRTDTYTKLCVAQVNHERANGIADDWDFSLAEIFLQCQEEKK